MGMKGKLTIETEINGSAHKYYNIMKAEIHRFPNISSDKVSSIELHEGDWHEHGAIKNWTYTINGRTETLKEKIAHDDENMTVTITAIDGDVLEMCRSYTVIFQAIPSGGGEKDMVKVTLVYEKLKESDPAPLPYFDLVIKIFVEDFDAHLSKAA